jgi:glutathione S-transferase
MMDAAGTSAGEAAGAGTSAGAKATLYVIPGSHACRAGMLMLEHKRIPYRTVELFTGAHPYLLRLLGFPGNRQPIRTVDGRTHRSLALIDRLGTVPALRFGSERVQTNRAIARFLDRVQPEPPLFPAGAERRAAVEEAERWGDEVLQMAARRIALAAAARDTAEIHDHGGSGRLGALLSHNRAIRTVGGQVAARVAFRANANTEPKMLAELPAMLDHVDELIAAGVLNGAELNAADYMIAPSIALLSYRHDLRDEIAARPAGELIDRILPMP